jgi:hypothetical protein
VPVQKQTPPRSAPDTEGGSSARLPSIRSIPTTYRGTYFRSRLEARWAATFDQLGWYWEYEPDGVDMDGVRYLCDFWLPHQRCWVEVKGPTNDRLDKTNQLRKAVPEHDLVVIGRPAGPGGLANWDGIDTNNVGIFTCEVCDQCCFVSPASSEGSDWRCRNCGAGEGLDPTSRVSSASYIEVLYRECDRGNGLTRAFLDEILTGLPFSTIPRTSG